ncbi:MAG: ATP-dependent RecD-like DNA helicase [Chloroflexi bacterium]|nr:ATP-dependent RecD-like DNA helicase [Chloroflexota bacterium]
MITVEYGGNTLYGPSEETSDDSIHVLEQNPYQIANDITGVGFKTADKLAQSMGLAANDERRLEAGIAHALNRATLDGNIYLPEEVLIETASELLSAPSDLIQAAIARAHLSGFIEVEKIPGPNLNDLPVTGYYLPQLREAERGLAALIHAMIDQQGSRLNKLRDRSLSTLVAEAAAEANVELTAQQQMAVEVALENKVSVLTGGPGTGKTTTIRALIVVLRRYGFQFALASPTGRAAKRLSETTGERASTIHRLLGYSPHEGWAFDEDDPLEYDFIVVDESSMLDTHLAFALMRAIHPQTHVLFVGDVDQLPSVGPGDVLRDLIRSGVVPVSRLSTIFRQSLGSNIIANAHRINQGEMPAFEADYEDVFLFKINDDPERAADLLVDVVTQRMPEKFNLDPYEDIQVLVPMYRGPAGVDNLNQRLQDRLNPGQGKRVAEYKAGGRLYRVGDKVIQTSNNYDLDIFNGDIGIIRKINFTEGEMEIWFDGRPVDYRLDDVASDLRLAYAISVHRSQGSEYPAVVLPIVTQHYMLLQRNLLYTAITRAKQIAIMIGSQRAISIAVGNNRVAERYTSLKERLQRQMGA